MVCADYRNARGCARVRDARDGAPEKNGESAERGGGDDDADDDDADDDDRIDAPDSIGEEKREEGKQY